MAVLPSNYTVLAAAGSQWSNTFTIYNDDDTLADLSTKVFEFVVRDRLSAAGTVSFSVSSTASTANGTIVVNLLTSTVQVIVNAVATNLVTEGGGPYTLWMNQNLADATALVTGTFYTSLVANP